MALINCPECGKEISDTANTCINCGFVLHKKESLFEKVKKNSKKIIISIGVIAIIVLLATMRTGLVGDTVESSAMKYIRETKKNKNAEIINGVACISNKYYGREENTLGYVVLYTTKSGSDIAYYEDGVYKGNGSNGGEALKSEDMAFYNMHALSAADVTLQFILDENLTISSCEKHYENEEGVIYIKLDDFSTWIENN